MRRGRARAGTGNQNHLAEAVDRASTRVFSLFRQHLNTTLGAVRTKFFDPTLKAQTEMAHNYDAQTDIDQAMGLGSRALRPPCVEEEGALAGIRRARAVIPATCMEFP